MALTEIDRRLIERCLAKSPGAWHDFVDRFIGLFLHVIQHSAHSRSISLTPADTEDYCSDIFVELLENDYAVLRNFRGNSSLATYLTVVARRIVVRSMIRRRQASLGHVPLHLSLVEKKADAESHQRIEDREELETLLSQLSSTDARIVRMYHLEGRSYREISQALRISENSIGPTLTRARDKLKELRVVDTA